MIDGLLSHVPACLVCRGGFRDTLGTRVSSSSHSVVTVDLSLTTFDDDIALLGTSVERLTLRYNLVLVMPLSERSVIKGHFAGQTRLQEGCYSVSTQNAVGARENNRLILGDTLALEDFFELFFALQNEVLVHERGGGDVDRVRDVTLALYHLRRT